jgi:DNA-binding CsgD family transcriptional regulator
LPDAVEALVVLRRVDDAERLVTVLETNGTRLGRPWMLAVGGRCRAMLLSAEGDLDAATVAAERAMAEHDRLPMPFERARTQLLLGQLQRRSRRRDVATTTLREALTVFEDMGTPLWARRAEAELARMSVDPNRTGDLTPSEHRVAELAASGMTNRDVATALFISPKTVEANLARVYRKLGIHSRAELGQRWERLGT